MKAKIILITLMILSLGLAIGKHGQESKPKNAWDSVVSFIITMVLLYHSGFFNELTNQ